MGDANGDVRSFSNTSLILCLRKYLRPGSGFINCVDPIVNRIGGTEVGQINTVNVLVNHPTFQTFQILSPIQAGVD